MTMKLKKFLLPYQWDWVRQDLSNEIALKARRTGFTWGMALKMVIRASQGTDQNIISHTEDGSKLVIQDVRFWVEWLCDNGYSSESDWEIQITQVRHKGTGSIIRSLPCVPRNIRGKKGDVFIDEAAWIPNLPEMLDACLPLKMWGGRISLISTSNPYNKYWNQLLVEPIWDLTIIDLPTAVDQGLYRRICEVAGLPEPSRKEELAWVDEMIELSGDAAGAELLCQTEAVSRGSWVSPNTVFVPVPIVQIDASTQLHPLHIREPHVWGVDIGTESAPTSLTAIGSKGRLLASYIIRGMRLPEIESVLGNLINSYTSKMLIDTNGIGRGVGEHMRDRFGTKIVFCPNESKWINTQLLGTLGSIWSGTVEVSDDPECIADLNSIQIKDGKVKIAQRSVQGTVSHGDTIVSLAIAHTGLHFIGTQTFWDL